MNAYVYDKCTYYIMNTDKIYPFVNLESHLEIYPKQDYI